MSEDTMKILGALVGIALILALVVSGLNKANKTQGDLAKGADDQIANVLTTSFD